VSNFYVSENWPVKYDLVILGFLRSQKRKDKASPLICFRNVSSLGEREVNHCLGPPCFFHLMAMTFVTSLVIISDVDFLKSVMCKVGPAPE